jgi:hypothetical protein
MLQFTNNNYRIILINYALQSFIAQKNNLRLRYKNSIMSLRTQLQRGRAGLQGRLANMQVGQTFEIPSTGAVAQVVQGTYKANKTNDKLGRSGQPYKTIRIISNSQKGQSGLMVNGRPISRVRKTIDTSQAQRAFNAYWNRKIREGKAKGPTFERAALAARGRDIAYGRPDKLVNDSRYRQRGRSPGAAKSRLVGPGPYEFQGVDFGAKRYNVARPSQSTIDKLVANARSRLAADISAGRKKAGSPEARARAALGRAQVANRRNASVVAANLARRQALAEQVGAGYGRRY